MAVTTSFSRNLEPKGAADEIAHDLQRCSPTFVLYFASSEYDQAVLAEAMKVRFPEASVCGCSTAGELVTGKMMNRSCVAMGFDHDTIAECSVQPLYNIADENHIPHVFRQFERMHGIRMADADRSAWVGIILIDGLQKAEETVMETIGSHTSIPFIGASAGDDMHFDNTWVHCQGKAMNDAAVCALLKPGRGFEIIKTQSFRLMHKKLTATNVDEKKRTVLEFNYKPATLAYSEALGIPEGEVCEKFMSNPVGLMIDGEPFVRSPQQILDRAIIFYCAVKQGMELQLLQSTNIIEDTKKAIDQALSGIERPAALVNFNCILRTIELDQNDELDDYGRLFTAIPTIGFSTYGEEYIGHINQTATMLLFK
ncbi:MAG: FIST C-terminal domain-containing protein [Chitinispirillaceae bacterium]|nr:FIST C-terminal domain-containing protein [Chitinispirillaceae bacterium]